VIGDTEADVAAGRAAGARAILVPNGTTLEAEVARAPEVAPNLEAAVDWLVGA
jgi:phosphoglycolate phosphatase-like HAD superfamily hydrolase